MPLRYVYFEINGGGVNVSVCTYNSDCRCVLLLQAIIFRGRDWQHVGRVVR